MARSKKERGPTAAQPVAPRGSKAAFAIHEPIGRTLRALFDEVAEQPVPEKLQELRRELERKKAKD